MNLIAAVLGALAGIVTGLIPGIHVNTVTALLLGSSAVLASFGLGFSALLAFTCALAISHTFFDVVPGLFLAIPGDEAFAQLPGHRLVKDGEGEAAIRLSVLGSAMGLVLGLTVMLVGTLTRQIERLEGWISPVMFYVLAGVSVILILTDRPRRWALFTFLSSGLLGIAVFGSSLVAGGSDAPVNALFPALAGLFGVAGLLFAIGTAEPKQTLPPSVRKTLGLSKLQITLSGWIGGIAGLLVGLLPGLGAANAATMLLLIEERMPWRNRRRGHSQSVIRSRGSRDEAADARSYLVTTSSLNTSEALFAIAALYVIQRSRSGASIAVEQILGGEVIRSDLTAMAVAMGIAGVVAITVMWSGGPRFAGLFSRLDETGINWAVITFLAVLTFALLGLGGLTILVAATAIGMIPLLYGVRRAQLMGFFLVPAMLFFSGYQGQIVALLPIEQRTAPLLPSITFASINIAILAAAVIGVCVYFATRGAGAWTDQRPRARLAVGTVGGLVATTVLVLALMRYAYPKGMEPPLTLAPPAQAVGGCIDDVIDGDTFRLDSMGRRIRVRLKGIDAPELRTTDGHAARAWVEEHFAEACVDWNPEGVDVYGRIVAGIFLKDGTFLNGEIVRAGYARVITEFAYSQQNQLLGWENEARAAKHGIWGDTPPPRAQYPAPEIARWDDNGDGRITCMEARRHDIAPVTRSHPAYPFMHDGNDDGIVCTGGAPPVPSSREASQEAERWDDNGDGRITCAEARRHGITPVRRGHPAYPFMNDGNDDGIVCN